MKKYQLIGKNVPSSKNSKMLTKSGKIIPSKLCQAYINWALPQLETIKDEFLAEKELINEQPLKVGFYFYRDSARRYDFINVVQILADMFVEVGLIEDDDTKHFLPTFLGEERVLKEDSGVVFKIIKTI